MISIAGISKKIICLTGIYNYHQAIDHMDLIYNIISKSKAISELLYLEKF